MFRPQRVVFPQPLKEQVADFQGQTQQQVSGAACTSIAGERQDVFHVTIIQTLAAALAGYALSHTIAKAMWFGLVTRNMQFYRTPKMTDKPGLINALSYVRQEIFLLVTLVGAVVGINLRLPMMEFDIKLWIIVLHVQAIPYFAALLTSLISGLPNFCWRLLHPKNREIKTH